MNKQYLRWLREVSKDPNAIYFSNTFRVWLRSNYWRTMWREGMRPDVAASKLIPW
jgi:hypothetical protein